MSKSAAPLSFAEYDRMVKKLETMAGVISLTPESKHNFGERLAVLTEQIREVRKRTLQSGATDEVPTMRGYGKDSSKP